MSAALLEAADSAFVLPPSLEAHEPPEARGLARDEVRLMVSHLDRDEIEHDRFTGFARHVRAGDLLVVNASATVNAALPARRAGGDEIVLHLSQPLPSGMWSVELRRPSVSRRSSDCSRSRCRADATRPRTCCTATPTWGTTC